MGRGLAVPRRTPAVEPATASGGFLLPSPLCHPPAPGTLGTRLLAWVALRSITNLPLCVRASVFIDATNDSAFLPPLYYCAPSHPLLRPLLSFSRVFWEPKRDRFCWRPLLGSGRPEPVRGGSLLLQLERGKKNQTKSENRCTSSGRQEVPGLSLAGLPGVQGCGGARPGSRAWHLSMLARGRRPESPVPCWVTSDRQPYPGSWSAPGARLGQGPGTLGLLSWHLRAVLRLTWGGECG